MYFSGVSYWLGQYVHLYILSVNDLISKLLFKLYIGCFIEPIEENDISFNILGLMISS